MTSCFASGLRTTSLLGTTPIAGPSRLTLIAVPTARLRFASTRSTHATPKTTSPARSAAAPTAPPTTRATAAVQTASLPRVGRAAWPWRALPSAPGTIAEERLIYARPYEGPLGPRVRMLWFFVPLWGVVCGFYLTTPKVSKRDEKGEIIEEKETPESVIWDYSTALAMFGITFMGALWLLSPSRFVTRMSQVRIRPAPGATASETIGMGKGEKIVVRMHHGGHLMMWGKAAEPREVPVENVKIRFIGSQRSPYLSLKVATPHTSRFNMDAIAYRLDFRDTAVVKKSEGEVVLSLQRLESVFGRIH